MLDLFYSMQACDITAGDKLEFKTWMPIKDWIHQKTTMMWTVYVKFDRCFHVRHGATSHYGQPEKTIIFIKTYKNPNWVTNNI